MISSNEYFIYDGTVINLKKNLKSKSNISIRVKNYVTTVTYPKITPIFAVKRIIKKDINFQNNIKKSIYKNPLKINQSIIYLLNKPYTIKNEWCKKFRYSIVGDSIKLFGQDDIFILMNKLSNKFFNEFIYPLILKVKNELFPELKTTKIIIQKRYMTTRWGVCKIGHDKNNIKIVLNTLLVHYPLNLIKYVIIHEICHINFPNHGKEFWSYVEKKEKNYKMYRKELKNFVFK